VGKSSYTTLGPTRSNEGRISLSAPLLIVAGKNVSTFRDITNFYKEKNSMIHFDFKHSSGAL
jgi:hypothetical protein